jgi:MFS family permease
MGTIAAPLLASVSIALIAVVLSSAATFRWVNVALLLLVVAAIAFVATVEFSFMARQYVVTPSELEDWWPDAASPSRRRALRREQRYYHSRFRHWAVGARYAYNLGILALGLAVVALLVPHGSVSHGRRDVIIVAGLAFLAELAWIAATLVRHEEPELPEVSPEPPSPVAGAGSGSS